MPNGRSGGFVIETADLKELVSAVADTAVVGKLTTGLRPQTASAAEISRCIEECPLDRIAVEEQDNAFYIIHISNEPAIVWVSVNSGSPIFAQLRQRHARWMAEHPGWSGWIGSDAGIAADAFKRATSRQGCSRIICGLGGRKLGVQVET